MDKTTFEYTVPNLKEGKETQFRVTAKNEIGDSEPLCSKLVTPLSPGQAPMVDQSVSYYYLFFLLCPGSRFLDALQLDSFAKCRVFSYSPRSSTIWPRTPSTSRQARPLGLRSRAREIRHPTSCGFTRTTKSIHTFTTLLSHKMSTAARFTSLSQHRMSHC